MNIYLIIILYIIHFIRVHVYLNYNLDSGCSDFILYVACWVWICWSSSVCIILLSFHNLNNWQHVINVKASVFSLKNDNNFWIHYCILCLNVRIHTPALGSHRVRLVSAAAQYHVSELLMDTMHVHRLRAQGTTSHSSRPSVSALCCAIRSARGSRSPGVIGPALTYCSSFSIAFAVNLIHHSLRIGQRCRVRLVFWRETRCAHTRRAAWGARWTWG